jgi:hypothetical protein
MVAQKTVILRFIDSSFENDNSNSSGLSTLGDNALRITPYVILEVCVRPYRIFP